MALQIGQREVRNVTILDLEGQLVAGDEAASFRQRIDVLIEAAKIWILANLEDLKMIDSSGLGVLVSAHLALEKAGGAIKLVNASHRHINLLVLSKLTTVFPHFEDEEAGINSFLPEGQMGRSFDILEFVRAEENSDEPFTGGKTRAGETSGAAENSEPEKS